MLKYLDPSNESSRNDRSSNKKAHLKPGGEPPTGETSKPDAEDGEGNRKSQDPDEEYLKKLHGRVFCVLKGHLRWICAQTKPWRDGSFAPHYWPTGRIIENIRFLSSPSLIDTPLQLLKVYHILGLESDSKNEQNENSLVAKLQSDEQWDKLVDELRPKVRSWIEEMHAANERGTYIFFRKPKHGYHQFFELDNDENKEPKYCLTDHVMIGMALSTRRNRSADRSKETLVLLYPRRIEKQDFEAIYGGEYNFEPTHVCHQQMVRQHKIPTAFQGHLPLLRSEHGILRRV
jgi:hypothetical protein